MTNFVYGLGGRDVKIEDIESIFNELLEILEKGKKEFTLKYIGVREDGHR